MALTKIKLNTGMVTGSLPDANIPDDITVNTASAVPASGLTGNTLASGVTASSLQSVGTLSALNIGGQLTLSTPATPTGSIKFLDTGGTSQHASIDVESDSGGMVLALNANSYITTDFEPTRYVTNKGSASVMASGAGEIRMFTGGTGADPSRALTIDSSQRVGIGSASPESQLTFSTQPYTTSADNGIRVQNPDTTADAVIQHYENSDYVDWWIGGNTYVNTSGGVVRYNNSKGTSAINISPANQHIVFYTGGTGEDPQNRMRITSTGSIGISNSSPQALLHVGTGADTPFISATALVSNAGTTNLAIRNASSNIELLNYVDSSQGIIGCATNHPLIIRTNNANRMYLRTDGKIGIGDDSPTTAKLSISHDDTNDANALYLYNPNTSANAKVNLNFGLERNASAVKFIPARLQAGKEQEWTGTPSTVDGYLALQVVENETLTERVRVNSRGGISTNGITVHTSSSAKYGGSGSSGADHSLARFWHDVVNWGDGGVIVEIFNYYYGHAQQGYGKFFCTWGYSNNTRVTEITSTGSVNDPTWSSAVHVSGNIYRRDLNFNVPQYNIAKVRFTTAVSPTTDINNTSNNRVYFY